MACLREYVKCLAAGLSGSMPGLLLETCVIEHGSLAEIVGLSRPVPGEGERAEGSQHIDDALATVVGHSNPPPTVQRL
jgi:hypothetical protein